MNYSKLRNLENYSKDLNQIKNEYHMNDDNYNELTSDEIKRLRFLYNTIIKKVIKKKRIKNNSKHPFRDYMYSNPMVERAFSFEDQKKIKKYLNNYFKFRNIPIISKLSKNYKTITKIINELEDITDEDIDSFNKFMIVGRTNYHDKNDFNNINLHAINESQKQDNNFSLKDKEETLYPLPTNKNKENEIKDNSIIKPKKIDSKEIKDLYSEKRKYINKIKKIEQIIDNETNERKIKIYKQEIIILKVNILDIEKEIINKKKQDNSYKDIIENSNNIRKEKSIKVIETYIKRFNNRKTNLSINEYFGDEQIEYFYSIGIDVDKLLENKLKKRRIKK